MNKNIYVVMEYCSLEHSIRNLNFLNKIQEVQEDVTEEKPVFTNILQKEEYVVEE